MRPAQLDTGDAHAVLECAFDRAKPRTCTITGERGSIVVEDLHRPTRAIVRMDGRAEQVLAAPYEVDDFFGEISHFVGLLLAGATESPLMSLENSERTAGILDAVRVALASRSTTEGA